MLPFPGKPTQGRRPMSHRDPRHDSRLHWRIGDVRITRFLETEAQLPLQQLIQEATPEALENHASWLRPHFLEENGNITLAVQAFVIESEGQKILVDTCVGEHTTPGFEVLAPQNSSFLADLSHAGFDRESIDIVLCTHMHFDHVGWNTMRSRGKWIPTFPNARYLFARKEWEHWDAQGASPFTPTLDDAVRPILAAKLADLVATDHQVTSEVRLEATPGHTPGHVAVVVDSRGHKALITGDLTHHPVQWAEVDWKMNADSDSAQAAATRRRLLAEHDGTDTLVIGTHYPAPCAGRLRNATFVARS